MLTFEIRIILVFLTSLFAGLYVLPRLSKIAKAIGLTDKPGDRKVHKEALPLVGGIGMTIAATFSALIFVPITGLRGYFLGLAVLLFIGFLDDFKEVGHFQKFAAQIAATALLMFFSKVYLLSFGDLIGIGDINIPNVTWVIWGVTIFCVVGVVNAINLIDGLDGLAGGISFVAFLAFAVHASLAENHTIMLLNLALAGAVLGFLRFNWSPAALFMGDAGSLCLGFSLAFMALILTQGENAQIRPVVALLVLAVPITDTITVMSKRILRGESPFKADQYHLHHIFMRSGMGREWAVKVIVGISILLSGISLLGTVYDIRDSFLFLAFALYFVFYIFSSFYSVYLMRFSLKIRWKKEEPNYTFDKIIGCITRSLDFFKVLRKSTRHQVELDLICYDRERECTYAGKVLNISSGGFMAIVPDLDFLLEKIIVKIIFPLKAGGHSMELPVEHLWHTESEDTMYHGFRFLDFDGRQEKVVFKFLVKYKKNIDDKDILLK